MRGGIVVSRWKYYFYDNPQKTVAFLATLMDCLDASTKKDGPTAQDSVGEDESARWLFLNVERYCIHFRTFNSEHMKDTYSLRNYKNLDAATKWDIRMVLIRQMRVLRKLTPQKLHRIRARKSNQWKCKQRELVLPQQAPLQVEMEEIQERLDDPRYLRNLARAVRFLSRFRGVFLVVAMAAVIISMSRMAEARKGIFFWLKPENEEYSVFQPLNEHDVILEFNDYIATWLPSGFELTTEKCFANRVIRIYTNNDGYINLTTSLSNKLIKVDIENADIVERVDLHGVAADLVSKDGVTSLIWAYEKTKTCISVETNASRKDVMQIALAMKEVGSK